MSGANARLAASMGLDTRDYRRNMDGVLQHTRTAQGQFGSLAKSVAGLFSLQAIAGGARAIGEWAKQLRAAQELGKLDFIDQRDLDRIDTFGAKFEQATLRAKAGVLGIAARLGEMTEQAAAFWGALAGGDNLDGALAAMDTAKKYADENTEALKKMRQALVDARKEREKESGAATEKNRIQDMRQFYKEEYAARLKIYEQQKEEAARAQRAERERGLRMADEIDAANRAKEEDRNYRQRSILELGRDQQSLLSARNSVRVEDRFGGSVDSVQRSGGLLAASPTVAIRAEAEKVAAAKLTEINTQLATIAGWIKTATEELSGND